MVLATPLMLSCFTGHVSLTSILLAHNANVNLQNNEGITALMMSSYNAHRETTELLLFRYGADVSISTNIGMTALGFSKNEEVTALLREFGGKPSLGKRTLSIKIESCQIKEIKSNCSGESKVCLREMLHKWLTCAFPNPTWHELTEAVESAMHGTVDITCKMAKN